MKTLALQKILIPIDYRAASLNALDMAVAMSQRHGAEIRLLHMITPGEYELTWDDYIASSESFVETELQNLRDLAAIYSTEKGIHCSYECRLGKLSDGIAEAAQDFKADCIVMGTHSISGFREYFVGSEAYRVVRATSCPVLTVPHFRKWTHFKEIIFPIRPIQGSLDKYDLARPIALKNKAHLTIIGLPAQNELGEIDRMKQQIAQLDEQLVKDGIDWDTFIQITRSSAKTVLQKAAATKADLIIITADQDTDRHHFIAGPFVQQIVNHAQVPVLAVRAQSDMPLRLMPTDWQVESINPLFSPTLPPLEMG